MDYYSAIKNEQILPFVTTQMDLEGMLVAQLCLTVTPWTEACQVPLSTRFSRQEYWSGLPFPSPGNLPDPGIEPESPALQADSLPTEVSGISLTVLSLRPYL